AMCIDKENKSEQEKNRTNEHTENNKNNYASSSITYPKPNAELYQVVKSNEERPETNKIIENKCLTNKILTIRKEKLTKETQNHTYI
ncbi:MAG: hypothetical protein RR585_06760, partial [Coprobacillus sp.]